MIKTTKYILKSVAFLCLLCTFSCKNTDKSTEDVTEKGVKTMKMLQGIWVNEDDGNVFMCFKGDSIYYPDNIGEPVAYKVANDTLHLCLSFPQVYIIRQLTDSSLRFVNNDGDEFRLLKSKVKSDIARFEHKNDSITEINQGILIKRDSIITVDDKHFHAYVQINPTSYKVLKQGISDNGVSVEKAYYDNIIHVSVYEGAKKLYSHDFRKTDFSKFIPTSFLEGGILSDIKIKEADERGVKLEAIVAQPDSYATYVVVIIVSNEGKVTMSV